MAIAFVQDRTDSQTSASTINTGLDVAPAAGSLIVAIVTGNNEHVTSVTGGGVTQWQVARNSNKASYIADVWYGVNTDGSTANVTINFAGATSAGINVSEWTGAGFPDVSSSTNSGTSTTPTPGSITAATPGPVLYIATMARAAATAVSSGPTDSFLALEVSGGAGVIPNVGCYRIDSGATPAAANPSWTLAGSVAWEMTIVAFRSAFPVIESKTADNATGGAAVTGDTAATSHSVTLPATISPGALLVIVGRVAAAGTVAVTGGGWTIAQDASDASDDQSFWMYRDTLASGTEDAGSITVTHASGKMVAIAMSITGSRSPAIRTPEASTVAIGTGSNPGPTTATPTGGINHYLWIAVGLADGEHTAPPATIPASYGASSGSGTGTGGLPATNSRAYVATRDLRAASEDPGTWTTSVAVQSGWTSWALAIHPATLERVHRTTPYPQALAQ